jgi:hypothetical protein
MSNIYVRPFLHANSFRMHGLLMFSLLAPL